MTWKVVARPQVQADVIKAADWYDSQRPGLGEDFIEEIFSVFDTLKTSPLIHSIIHLEISAGGIPSVSRIG